jgi:hypothetical protein
MNSNESQAFRKAQVRHKKSLLKLCKLYSSADELCTNERIVSAQDFFTFNGGVVRRVDRKKRPESC